MAVILIEDVARDALSAVGSNAGLTQAIRWASQRYRETAMNGQLRHLQRVGEVTIPACVQTGLVTATRGSNLVTGDTDAQAVWTQDVVGRYFRFRRVWYRIAGIDPGPILRLSSEVTEEDATDVAYKIVQKHTPMPRDMRKLGRCVLQRLWRPLTPLSLSELDLTEPERLYVADTGPEVIAEVGDDEDGTRLVEFYPYPNTAATIRFIYWLRTSDFAPGDPLPDDIDPEHLKAGMLIDIYRWEMSQALRTNKVEAAAVWRNEARAQETVWKKRIEDVIRDVRATEDSSLILYTAGPPYQNDLTFIKTARQDAISRLTNFP